MVLRDLNKDGYTDLLVACDNWGHGAKSFAFYSRRGRFEKPGWLSDDLGVSASIAAGDCNGDGYDDIVLSRYNGDPLVAYRGRADGLVEQTPFWRSADDEWAHYVLIGDFNHDQHLDVLADGRIYHGSDGGLSPRYDWRLSGELGISGIVWTDIDGDSRRDLVTSSWIGGPAYSVFRGLEKDFGRTASWESAQTGEYSGLCVGDINGDGYPEIFVGSRARRLGDGRVRMYSNAGGLPSRTPAWTANAMDCNTSDMALADFDNDGDLDLFLLESDHMAVYENRNGTLAFDPSWSSPSGGSVIVVGDLDKSGWTDIVVARGAQIYVYMSDPNATVAEPNHDPMLPAVKPLKMRDLLPDSDDDVESLLRQYREGCSPEVMDKLRRAAVKVVNAISCANDQTLEELLVELRPSANDCVVALLTQLNAVSAAEREKAISRLVDCGPFVIPYLKRLASSDNADLKVLANRILERVVQRGREKDPEAIEVLGIGLARLTNRLKRRYGFGEIEGVVVLSCGEGLGPPLGLGNVREGDVFTAISKCQKNGVESYAVRSPVEMLTLVLDHCTVSVDESPPRYRIGYEVVCGPMHPSTRNEVRSGRLFVSEQQLRELKDSLARPRPWKPEK